MSSTLSVRPGAGSPAVSVAAVPATEISFPLPGPDTAPASRRAPASPHPAVAPVVGDLLVATLVALAVPVSTHASAWSATATLAAVWPTLLAVVGVYRADSIGSWAVQLRVIAVAALALLAVAPVLGRVSALPVVPVEAWTVATLLAAGSVLQRGVRRSAVFARGPAAAQVRVVVIGHRRDAQRVTANLAELTRPGYAVVATLSPSELGPDRGNRLTGLTSECRADAVLVAPCRHLDPAAVRRLGWQLEASRTRLLVATPLLDVDRDRTRSWSAGPLHLIDVRPPRLEGWRSVFKTVVERAAAAAGLLVLLPALLVVAALIRWESEGPALFRQTRVGKDGRQFSMLKFRTMRVDAEEHLDALRALTGPDTMLFKLRDDPRTTRVGRFLRRYSLDELPQLVNVVRGEMALVGPRPAMPGEVARYRPDDHRRLAVMPGITGLWQVSGRSDLSWEQSVRLDLRYVDNWSLGFDLRILGRTVGAVLHHRGAY